VHIYVHRASSTSRLRTWLDAHWLPDKETILPGFILPFLPLLYALGMLRYQTSLPSLTPEYIAWYNDDGKRYAIVGVVEADPEFRDTHTLLELSVDQIQPLDAETSMKVHGRLLARLPPGGVWRYGDRVRLEGQLRTPADGEDFSFRTYLAHQGIYSSLTCYYCTDCKESELKDCAVLLERDQGSALVRLIYSLRANALAVIYRLFPDPEASLLAGILIGVETGIPQDVMDAFRTTGTSHIIAISGFNFAIIAGLFVIIFGRLLGRWRSLPAAWIGIALYAVLAGASAGVVRAAVMGSLCVFALRMGRRSAALNTLAFVAGIMAVFDPHVLWDVGFQLSFMATLGLLLYAEPLSLWFISLSSRWLSLESARRLAEPVGEFLLFTLAAQLTTLPLILYYFHQLSLVSLLANPLVLPAQPPLMVLGGLAVIAGLIAYPLGRLLALLTWPWIAYSIRIVELLARAPGASLTIAPVSIWLVFGFYLVLFAITLSWSRLKEWIGRITKERSNSLGWALIAGLSLLVIVIWQHVFSLPDGRLHLTVLDVGNGDALLIQTPEGRSLLVDGGPAPNRLSSALGRRLPVGEREIDFLVVAASAEPQTGGLPRVLDRFRVNKVLWSGPEAGSYSARELQKRLIQAQIPIFQAQTGQALDLGKGAQLEVLAQTQRGAVLLLRWDRFRVLMPIGLDFESMDTLMQDRNQGPVTALLLAEAGHASLNTLEWIEHWQPRIALLSVSLADPEGLPHTETLAALKGVTILRTDLNGWIRLSTDGKNLWVEVEK
jgi:competence protein ComEC